MKKLEDKHTPAPDGRWKGKFPEGLRVLAVDDNVVCLRLLKAFLLQCRYKVTATTEASTALKLLRESKNHDKFDIVITDVHMLDMDGFRLLEIIGHEMDLPVIMMSSNDVHHTVMKGVEHGACDYLLKPIRLGEIKNIWQHVVRKNKFDAKDFLICEKGIADQTSRPQKRPISQNCKREDGTSLQRDEHSSSEKKPRLVWCNELSAKFIDAYNKLGKDNAVASKILELMNVPNLTREQVASHLQKHRKNLQKSESQESKTKISCNRRDGEPPNTTVLSFEGQHHIALNVYNSFRFNGYSTPGATHFIRHVQHPYSITQSQVNPRPLLLPLNQQNVVLPQCPQSVEVLGQNCQQIKVPRLGVFPSHSLTMENMHVQSCFSRPKYQPFPSETKGCNGGMEISPNFASCQKSSEQCSSDFPLLEEGFSDAILSNNDDNDDDFTRNYQMILEEFSSEPLEADNNFSLNSSSSFDDLDAAIKQFRH